MKSLSSAISALRIWPQEVVDGVTYQVSRLQSPAQGTCGDLNAGVKRLPAEHIFRKLFSHNRAEMSEGFELLSQQRVSSLAFNMCCDLGAVLHLSESGTKGKNKALRRSLLVLRDRLLGYEGNQVHLAEQTHRAIRTLVWYQSFFLGGITGSSGHEDCLMLMIGMNRIARHPNLRNLDLKGPTPKERHFLADVANLAVFIGLVGVGPAWVAAHVSLVGGVVLSILALSAGGFLVQASNSNPSDKPPPPNITPPQRDSHFLLIEA